MDTPNSAPTYTVDGNGPYTLGEIVEANEDWGKRDAEALSKLDPGDYTYRGISRIERVS